MRSPVQQRSVWTLAKVSVALVVASAAGVLGTVAFRTVDLRMQAALGQCGNAYVNWGEECDRGVLNGNPTYGCSTACTALPGWTCVTGTEIRGGDIVVWVSHCTKNCGNGHLDSGEECDNGNANGSDGVCTSACTRVPKCGDGFRSTGEECGEPGLQCQTGKTCADCKCVLHCGNGVLDDEEQCDPSTGTTSCANGFTCPNCQCLEIPHECGNGTAESIEVCGEPGLASCPFGTRCNNCMQCVAVAPVCGDGFVSAGEQCGEPGLASCAAGKECRNCYCVSPYCGDGFPDVNEECGEPGLSCSDGKQCQYCQCKTVTTTAVCGNGVIEGAEECDDGNKGGGDGCSSTCTQEEGWSCMNDQVPSFTPTGGASFKDAGIRDIGAAALDEHRVLIAQVESSRVGIVVADVQDAGVTYGEMKFTGSIPSSADFPTADAIALGGGKAVVAYSERGNNGANISNCNLVYVSTEGKTVTVGKSVRIPLESSSRFCNRLKVVALSPQQLIVSYTDQNDWYDATNAQEKLVAVSVAADGSLTVGPVALGESNMESWYLLKADAGRFLLADYPVALRGVPIKTPRVRLGKVQNNAISFLGGVDLPSQYVVGMNMLDATHVFIQTVRQTSGIQVFTTSDVPYTVVGTLSATGIALEKPLPWNPSVQRSPLVPIAPNVFLFSYLKYGGAAGNDASKVGGYVVVATRNSDGTLSFLEPMNFDPGHYLLADGRNRAVITPLTQRKFFIVYPVRTTQNFGNGNGRGIVGTLVPASRSICRSDSAICGNDKSEAGEECGEPGKSCQAGFGCLDCKCLPVGVACGNNRIDAGEVCGEPGLQQCVPGDMCNNCKCIIAHPFLCTDMCKEGASGPSACKHVCVGFDRNPDASLCPNEGYVNSFSCTVGKPPCSYGCIR